MSEKKPINIIVGKLKKSVNEVLRRLVEIGKKKPTETEKSPDDRPPSPPQQS